MNVRNAVVLTAISTLLYGAQAQRAVQGDVLWYDRPAIIWDEALPVGNGRLGAMVFGGANDGTNNGDLQDAKKNLPLMDGKSTRPQDEHLQLNESTLWQGSRADLLNPRAHEGFLEARRLLLESRGTDSAKISQAEKLLEQTMLSTPRGMPGYSTLGDLYLRSTSNSPVDNDRRSLDLETGVVRSSYTQDHTKYQKETFASAPDQVIVVHLTANHPGAISFKLSMDRPADFTTVALDARNLTLQPSANHHDQTGFHAQVRLLTDGGQSLQDGNSLQVIKANQVTILISAATDFKGGRFAGGDPALQDKATLDRAAKKSYEQLREAATRDVSRYMQRMHFTLGAADAALEALPTNERLRRVAAGGNDLGLQSLYFQFARYLLVGSSRPGGLPANLQGLWAAGIGNPWGSKFTININTEMNYWLAEPGNLGDLHQPLFDLVEMVRSPGSGTGTEVARKYYGAQGFVIHHNTDIWGDAHPIDGVPYGIWPMGGAWLTLHAWDHYAFSLDRDFLRTRAWPLLHDASLFFLDYLVDDGTGHLVTGPSLSPENKYRMADGTAHSITMGPTMDLQIVRELFTRTLQAGDILHEDPVFLNRVRVAESRLLPLQVGKRGNLQEWPLDYDDAEPGHRHISHLWALFPGTQIDRWHTPDLARATQNTLQARLEHGGGQTGWSRAWVVNYWDRLGEGEKAYESMQVLFRQSTFPNMMDTHPPGVFQIDGNLGAANGMLEALVQSRWYPDHTEVDLFPALPSEWSQGSVTGLRLRGDGTLDLQWQPQGTTIHWHANRTGPVDLRLPQAMDPRKIVIDDKPVLTSQINGQVVRLNIVGGHIYTLRF
ncbi:glycoside hydrolase family 95 protein [Terriglobus albidus]|uniref:glycoside hydrolase family 95 protein n=1 Tax=Terriglobus albidus TaxID=1592106 RepID=UPI0021DF718F|nr:glycoside hydrolase family 95 protein [Terriglobus albidus]